MSEGQGFTVPGGRQGGHREVAGSRKSLTILCDVIVGEVCIHKACRFILSNSYVEHLRDQVPKAARILNYDDCNDDEAEDLIRVHQDVLYDDPV